MAVDCLHHQVEDAASPRRIYPENLGETARIQPVLAATPFAGGAIPPSPPRRSTEDLSHNAVRQTILWYLLCGIGRAVTTDVKP